MWIVFEGLDKSGKGTLEWELLKATNFKHIIIDRGPVGYLVFDNLFERKTKEGYTQFAKNISLMKVSEDFLVVYCKVSADIALKRIEANGETCPYNYEYAQELYDMLIEGLYQHQNINVITIDTSKPINECVELIVQKIKEVQ